MVGCGFRTQHVKLLSSRANPEGCNPIRWLDRIARSASDLGQSNCSICYLGRSHRSIRYRWPSGRRSRVAACIRVRSGGSHSSHGSHPSLGSHPSRRLSSESSARILVTARIQVSSSQCLASESAARIRAFLVDLGHALMIDGRHSSLKFETIPAHILCRRNQFVGFLVHDSS